MPSLLPTNKPSGCIFRLRLHATVEVVNKGHADIFTPRHRQTVPTFSTGVGVSGYVVLKFVGEIGMSKVVGVVCRRIDMSP